MIEASRDRLERKRRRLAERQVRTASSLVKVSVPSLGWISRPGARFGVASLLDVPGASLRINSWRFSPAADGVSLRRDFKAIGADMHLATEIVAETDDPDRPRLFDIANL